MSIIKHDIGGGLIDYYKNGKLVGHDRGKNAETPEQIGARLGDDVITFTPNPVKELDEAIAAEYNKTSELDQRQMIIDALMYPYTPKGEALSTWKEGIKAQFVPSN